MYIVIIYWIKVDYCFPTMSYNGLVYYLIFRQWQRPSALFNITYDGLVCYLIFRQWLKPSALCNRTNIMHMTTFVSRRFNILCIMQKIMWFFIITLFTRLYVRVDILLTRRKHLHDIISLTNLSHHFLLKCLYQARKERCHMFVYWGYRFCFFLRFLIFNFGIVPTMWYFLFFLFHYFKNLKNHGGLIQNILVIFIT